MIARSCRSETDPAGVEIDLWARSKEQNTKNFPPSVQDLASQTPK
jgi:hypothetical protein